MAANSTGFNKWVNLKFSAFWGWLGDEFREAERAKKQGRDEERHRFREGNQFKPKTKLFAEGEWAADCTSRITRTAIGTYVLNFIDRGYDGHSNIRWQVHFSPTDFCNFRKIADAPEIGEAAKAVQSHYDKLALELTERL